MFSDSDICPYDTNFHHSDPSELFSKNHNDSDEDEMSYTEYCCSESAILNDHWMDTDYFSNGTDSLNQLRILRGRIDLKIEDDRWKFLHQFYWLIKNWRGPLPNLRELFRGPQIDRLLQDAVARMHELVQDDRDPASVVVEFVARTGYKDDQSSSDGQQQQQQVRRIRTTALHRATRRRPELVKNLFEIYRDNGGYANHSDAAGLTHLHIACEYGFAEVARKFLEAGESPNVVWRQTGDAPLHSALRWDQEQLVELLLANGADPNLANCVTGETPLHFLCDYEGDDDDVDPVTTKFFWICDRENRRLNLDARDNDGSTPLQLAMKHKNSTMFARLLGRGADPNLRDKEGSTTLHEICGREYDDSWAETFFRINEVRGTEVPIDARDRKGRTPLHLALSSGNWTMAERLLLREADLGSILDGEGATALHIVCQRKDEKDIDSVKKFFEIIQEKRQLQVRIDARDKKGRTPLQWAVANFLPATVDALLDRGAHLSNFVFPSEAHYGETFPTQYATGDSKLKLVCRALLCLDGLDRRGYRLCNEDALTIVKLFAKFELFANTADRYLPSHEEFARRAKDIKIDESQSSLYDLIESRPMEAAKLIAIESPAIPPEFYWYNELHLCEMVSREFSLRWSLYPFWELIHYRLPIECCELIVDQLNNKDLFNVKLAIASGEENVNRES